MIQLEPYSHKPASMLVVYGFNCIPTSTGVGYTGSISLTRSGFTCQRWDTQQPHPHNVTARMLTDDTIFDAANHCRSPDGDTQGIWCYTTHPEVEWDYCDAPYCRK